MDAPPVEYATTSDGVSVAYSVSGEGRTVLVPPFIHSHVQFNWLNDSIIARRSRFLRRLADSFRVVTFDNRGQGLSSRGLPDSLSLADFDLDTEAVAERIEDRPFVFVACARSAHLAARYTVKHPERVSALVLLSAQMSMTSLSSGLFTFLPDQHWDFFLQTQLLPGLSPDEVQMATEMLKQTSTPEDYRKTWRTWLDSDITDLLPKLRVPTLVLHARDFPFIKPEEATRIAARIPNSRLVLVNGYEIMGEENQTVGAIEAFLDEAVGKADGSAPDVPASALSPRQAEVLRLIAHGLTNREVAETLVLSERTVERHVADAYAKIGVDNRAQAAVYARDDGIV